MRLKIIGLFVFLFVIVAVAVSQHAPQPAPHPGQPPHGPDPLAENLFPPEMIMNYRQMLGLSEEQKGAIKDELMKASARFSELQWQMQDEMETMVGLTKGANIDEQRVLAQLDKILNIERDVKRTQLTLAIRIKNKLTADQQTKLLQIQRHDLQPRPPEQ
jgi:Spy/CpxP family protein refolding chaperone